VADNQVSLWEARKQLALIRDLPFRDFDGFLASREVRRQAMWDFPEMQRDFEQAAHTWARESCSLELEDIKEVNGDDLAAVMIRLRALRQVMPQTTYGPEAATRILETGQWAFRIRLDQEKAAMVEDIGKGMYRRALERADDVTAALEVDAREVAMRREMAGIFNAFREFALFEYLATATTKLERLLQRKDYAAIADEGDRLWKEIAPFAAPLFHIPGTYHMLREPLDRIRKKALAARLDLARAEARELVRKDRYQAVGRTGEKAYNELREEARLVGLEEDLTRFRDSCRAFADQGRKANVADGK
jgi:hypothetical protein